MYTWIVTYYFLALYYFYVSRETFHIEISFLTCELFRLYTLLNHIYIHACKFYCNRFKFMIQIYDLSIKYSHYIYLLHCNHRNAHFILLPVGSMCIFALCQFAQAQLSQCSFYHFACRLNVYIRIMPICASAIVAMLILLHILY